MDFVLYRLNEDKILQIRQTNYNNKRLIIAVQFAKTINRNYANKTLNYIRHNLEYAWNKHIPIDVLWNNYYRRDLQCARFDEIHSSMPHDMLFELAKNLPRAHTRVMLFLKIDKTYLLNNHAEYESAIKCLQNAIIQTGACCEIFVFNECFGCKNETSQLLNIATGPSYYFTSGNFIEPETIFKYFYNGTIKYKSTNFIIPNICLTNYNIYYITVPEHEQILNIGYRTVNLSEIPVASIDKLRIIIYNLKNLLLYLARPTCERDYHKVKQNINTDLQITREIIPGLTRADAKNFPRSITMQSVRTQLMQSCDYCTELIKICNTGNFNIIRDARENILKHMVILNFINMPADRQAPALDYIETLHQIDFNNNEYQCYLSLSDLSDVIMNNDVLCLCVNLTDEYISPNYISLNTFASVTKIIYDVNRQAIDQALPLYICPEHWQLAKRYYDNNAINCFTVLYFALYNDRRKNNEFTKKQINILLDICLPIYKTHKLFYNKLLKRFTHENIKYIIGVLCTKFIYETRRQPACAEYSGKPGYVINPMKVYWRLIIQYFRYNVDVIDFHAMINVNEIIKYLKLQNNTDKCYTIHDLLTLNQYYLNIAVEVTEYVDRRCRLDVIIPILKTAAHALQEEFPYDSLHDFAAEIYDIAGAMLYYITNTPFKPWSATHSGYTFFVQLIHQALRKLSKCFKTHEYQQAQLYVNVLNNDHVNLKPGNDIRYLYDLLLQRPANYLHIIYLLSKHKLSQRKKNKIVLTYCRELPDLQFWNKIFNTNYYNTHFINIDKYGNYIIDQI